MKLTSKDDFLVLFKQINEPTQEFLTFGKSRIKYAHNGVGYGNKTAEIEGFSRILWGAGPGFNLLSSSWQKRIITGLSNGTNPQNSEYWGDINDFDQRMVEMPAIAMALFYHDQIIWKLLSKNTKQNVVNWLCQILEHQCADGNWQFFKIIVGTILKKLGYRINEDEFNNAFTRIESCYLGNGWYRDSSRGRQDYYNPYAFHYYGLIYSHLCPEQERSKEYLKRANLFARDYINFFDESGSHVPFGRSATYKFAPICFWCAMVWCHQNPYDTSIIKGIITRSLKWWLSKDIFDGQGILNLGYTYPQLSITEPYNSSLSSYWLNKVFILLDLPSNDDFWCAPVTPLPNRDASKMVAGINGIFYHNSDQTVFLNAGQPGPNFHALTPEKYFKFAYSTQFGYSIPRTNYSRNEQAMDSMLGVQRSDIQILTSVNRKTIAVPGQFMVRDNVDDVYISDDIIGSTWHPTRNNKIRTWLLAMNGWQIRIHRLELVENFATYETGFAISKSGFKRDRKSVV